MKIEFDDNHNSISGTDSEGKDFFLPCNPESYGHLKSKNDGSLQAAKNTLKEIQEIIEKLEC